MLMLCLAYLVLIKQWLWKTNDLQAIEAALLTSHKQQREIHRIHRSKFQAMTK